MQSSGPFVFLSMLLRVVITDKLIIVDYHENMSLLLDSGENEIEFRKYRKRRRGLVLLNIIASMTLGQCSEKIRISRRKIELPKLKLSFEAERNGARTHQAISMTNGFPNLLMEPHSMDYFRWENSIPTVFCRIHSGSKYRECSNIDRSARLLSSTLYLQKNKFPNVVQCSRKRSCIVIKMHTYLSGHGDTHVCSHYFAAVYGTACSVYTTWNANRIMSLFSWGIASTWAVCIFERL